MISGGWFLIEESLAFDVSPNELRVAKTSVVDGKPVTKSCVYRQFGPKPALLVRAKVVERYTGLFQDEPIKAGKYYKLDGQSRRRLTIFSLLIIGLCTLDKQASRHWLSTKTAQIRPEFPSALVALCLCRGNGPIPLLTSNASEILKFKTAKSVVLPNGDEVCPGDWVMVEDGSSQGGQLVGTIVEILQIDSSPNAKEGCTDFVSIRFADMSGIHPRLVMPMLRLSDRYGLVQIKVRSCRLSRRSRELAKLMEFLDFELLRQRPA